MLDKILAAMKEVTVVVVRIRQDSKHHTYNGDYDDERVRIRLHAHADYPLERVLIHEMLHHLYPDKNHDWVNKWERILWGRLSKKQHETLRQTVHKAKRR